MLEVKTKDGVFPGYVYEQKTQRVYSSKRGGVRILKPLSDRVSPTYCLYKNGERFIVSKEEIISHTLGVSQKSA